MAMPPEVPLLYDLYLLHPDPSPAIFNFTTGALIIASLPFALLPSWSPEDKYFNVTIGPGLGNYISYKLYKSIPIGDRPQLYAESGNSIWIESKQDYIQSIGIICMQIVLCDDMPGYCFQIKVWAHVLDAGDELDGMFIGSDASWISTASISDGHCYVTCGFGKLGVKTLKGELVGMDSMCKGTLWVSALRRRLKFLEL